MKKQTHEAVWAAILTRMRTLLGEKGITQTSIATRMGVDRGTVTRWLKGDRKASQTPIEGLIKYMQALEMDTSEYFASGENDEYIQVPWLEASASMGNGSLEISRELISHLSFRADWLAPKGSTAGMVVINADGDSMEPTIPDRAIVLINEAKAYPPINGKIYFVCYGEELFLKRLKVKDGKVIALISDNGNVERPIDPDINFSIIGRALWYGREL